jgi:hypothetical protein
MKYNILASSPLEDMEQTMLNDSGKMNIKSRHTLMTRILQHPIQLPQIPTPKPIIIPHKNLNPTHAPGQRQCRKKQEFAPHRSSMRF